MEARATSVNVLASRMSMNGETFGSEEMTEDKITPAEEDSTFNTVPNQPGLVSEGLTVIFLDGPWRCHEHGFRREAGLLLPLDVFPSNHVNLCQLTGGGKKNSSSSVHSSVCVLLTFAVQAKHTWG